MSGLKIHDVNCGFKAYKRSVVENLHLYGDLYRFIPILASRQNFKIAEIAINHRKRKFGNSKYGFGRFISGWLDLLTLFFIIRYLRRPDTFLGLLVYFLINRFCYRPLYYLSQITTGGIAYRQPPPFPRYLTYHSWSSAYNNRAFCRNDNLLSEKEDHQKFIIEKVNFTKKYST